MKNFCSHNITTPQHCTDMQRLFFSFLYSSFLALSLFTLAGCAIPDDIPYPTVEAEITAIEVEGMCDETGEGEGTAIIDRTSHTITLYVNDLVNPEDLKITKLEVTNSAAVIVNDTVRVASDTYPTGKLPVETAPSKFRVNFRHPQTFVLRTWQDYEWTIQVVQVIKREVEVEGQVGDAIVDPSTRVVIIYVNQSQDITKIKVNKFSLGGQHGSVMPDPTQEEAVDFTNSRRYYVKYAWSDLTYAWTVYVYTTQGSIEPTAQATTNTKGAALVSGTRPNGVIPTVEYRAESEAAWTAVAADDVKYPTSTSYEVEFKGLHSDIAYYYRVKFNDKSIEGGPFYFEGEQLENASFSDWHIGSYNGNDLYMPWAEGGECYWDTGNHGATTVGASNSTYVDEDGRRYANLQSKYIVIKFAAGNIFTGEYLKTDGTNGILSFGRPFSSRPQKLQFDYQYKTSPITRTGKWDNAYSTYISQALFDGLKGQPDSCSVYIALGDWEPVMYNNQKCPYLIRTRPSELHLMDMNDSHLIGFAQLTRGEDVNTWTTEQLTIDYRSDRTPTTIIVVAASSKYGDYFTGGESSLLKIDNLKLIY